MKRSSNINILSVGVMHQWTAAYRKRHSDEGDSSKLTAQYKRFVNTGCSY